MSYPLDLNATREPVVTEHTRNDSDEKWLLVLPGGVFYTKDLIVRNKANGKELHPLVDYRALELNKEATMRSGGKETASLLYIAANVKNIVVSRRVVGGEFSVLNSDLLKVINQKTIDELAANSWGQVVGKPNQYQVDKHKHINSDIYGFEHAIYLMDQIAQAINTGDSGAFGMIYQYIDRLKAELQTKINNDFNQANGQINTLKLVSKLPVGTIVTFSNSTNPATAFGYGRWRRLENTLLYATADNKLGQKKRVGEGTTYDMTGFAMWELTAH